MATITVEVNARRFAVPYECPCCGAAPDTELIVPLTPSKTHPAAPETAHALGFPYCKKCFRHIHRWDGVRNVETAIKVLGVLGGIVLALVVHWAVGIGVVIAGLAAGVLIGKASRAKAKAETGESCAGPGIAVHYLGWSGNASTFTFESHVYAARFAEQNQPKLVNIDPVLRKVLDGYKLARLSIPTPAAAIRAVPAAATVSDWIDRIQSAPGRVARLDWLARSLDAFADTKDRAAIIEATTKLEVAPVVDKLEQLAADAKKRHVQKAIIDARADNIPEELRDEVVRQLETRLR